MTVQYVPVDDDLEWAWFYHAQGWDYIVRLAGNHGFWSWLAVKR